MRTQQADESELKNFAVEPEGQKKVDFLLDLCVSSLRRGHANLLCIVPNLTDVLFRESDTDGNFGQFIYIFFWVVCSGSIPCSSTVAFVPVLG